jgi:hypothetical protein
MSIKRGAKTAFERALEHATGETIESLRKMPIDERRRMIERKKGRRMRFTSRFPFIGRGTILHNDILSREEVEERLDEALR